MNLIFGYPVNRFIDHISSITAQDYDAWGDICRSYSTTDTTVNKFTGKERDQETGYDYFGARYYDSRIGRWLQTEPLYDKYLQYSPYQYGLLNPMKLVDADGNDAIVSIEGNTITFTVNILYLRKESVNHAFALGDERIKYTQDKIDEAENEWNNVKKVEYKGKEYNVKFVFNFTETDIETFNKISDGQNYLNPTNDDVDPSVRNANELTLPNVQFQYEQHWPAHEFGHIMGLLHSYNKKSPKYKIITSVMGGSPYRKGPSSDEVNKLLDMIDINRKGEQLIKGCTKEPQL